jgi:hypothetical protein
VDIIQLYKQTQEQPGAQHKFTTYWMKDTTANYSTMACTKHKPTFAIPYKSDMDTDSIQYCLFSELDQGKYSIVHYQNLTMTSICMQIEKSSSDMKFLMYAIGEMTGLQCIIFYNCLHYKLSEIQGSLEQKFPSKP